MKIRYFNCTAKGDCSAELQTFFDSVNDNTTVIFESGEYYLSDNVTVCGKKNIRINAYSAQFITRYNMCDPYDYKGAFIFEGCEKLELFGFSVTTDSSVNTSGRVERLDLPNHIVDIRLLDGFTLTGEEKIFGFDSMDEDFTPNGHVFFCESSTYQYEMLEPDLLRLYSYPSNDNQISKLSVGELMCMKHSLYPHWPILFKHSKDVSLTDITVFSCPGVAVGIYPRCENFTFKRFDIRLPFGSKNLLTANTDGIHAAGLCGKLVLEDCYFEHMGDDSLNIHTEGAIIESASENTVYCFARREVNGESGNMIKLSPDWAATGDVINVYDGNTLKLKGKLTVKEYTEGKIIFDNIDGTFAAGDFIANSAFLPEVEIRRCTVHNSRARGLLIESPNVLIEDCRFYGSIGTGLLIAPDTSYWNEFSPTENLTVRGCVFDRCGRNCTEKHAGGIQISIGHAGMTQSERYSAGVHKNITIENNVFTGIKDTAVYAAAVDGLNITDNTFIGCSKLSDAASKPINTVNCININEKNNTII